MRSASQAVAYARRFTTYRTQYCLNFVQTMLASPWSGPSAIWAWNNGKGKHGPDPSPPAGVPVFWSGGKYGHVALSVGGGRVRSTDWPSRGRVGETSISNMSRAWGYRYLGWTEYLGGAKIPGVGHGGGSAVGSGTTVYVNRLRYGVRDSDSVRAMQKRLIQLGYKIPAGPTGNYLSQTVAAVKALQRDWRQAPQYATGRAMGPKQTARLFRGVSGVTIKP